MKVASFNINFTNWLVFIIIFCSVLIRFFLSSHSPQTLNTQEIELTYFTISVPQMISDEAFLEYAKANGHLFFFTPILYFFPFSLFGNSLFIQKIPNLVAVLVLSFLVFSLLTKFLPKGNRSKILLAILISLSPWLTILSFNYLPETLSLLFFLVSIVLFKNSDKKSIRKIILVYFCVILSAFSSWTGLFFIAALIIYLPLYILVLKVKCNLKKCLISTVPVFLVFVLLIFINKNYIKTSIFQNNFIGKLKPSTLTEEINERQKVDYLSMNKKFILPEIVRKATYNKPQLLLNKLVTQSVSLLDFEQFAYPRESYDLIRSSGILPKGNLPLLYFFEIPVLIFGIYLLIKNLNIKNLLSLFFIAAVPFVLLEKRNLTYSSIFLLPLIFFAEVTAMLFFVNIFMKFNRTLKQVLVLLFLLIAVPSVLNFNNLFFFNQDSYKRSDEKLFRNISDWLNTNRGFYNKVVVTDRFGPTHLASSFYLNTPPYEFWPNYLNPQFSNNSSKVVFENLEFRAIQPGEDKFPKTAYIGFPSEFFVKGKVDETGRPLDAKLIDEINFSDELVYQFGNKLWVIIYQ